MKALYIILALLGNLILLNCSSNDTIEPKITTRCFVVKEVNTDTKIPDARVYLQERLEVFDGYYYNTIIMGVTDQNGEVCLTFNKIIDRIESVADGYAYRDIDNPPNDLVEIFLFPQSPD
jgi:hypothetical protein